MKTLKTICFSVMLCMLLSSCLNKSETKKIGIKGICSDTLMNVLIIDNYIQYDSDEIIPRTMGGKTKFSFLPLCPFFGYNPDRNEVTIYSKFMEKDCHLDRLKTLVLVKHIGLGFEVGDVSTGYLYAQDTLKIRSFGLGNNPFNVISNNFELYIESKYDTLNGMLNVNYIPSFESGNSSKKQMKEQYKFTLINNVKFKILNDDYDCK